MRRSIAHLTGAAAVLAVLVAVSLGLFPGSLSPGVLPPPDASQPPAASAVGTPRPPYLPEATELPYAFWPVPHGGDGGGSARPN